MNIHKKAQGISINTVIIAAIALIVLVVLIAVFTGRIGLFGQGLDNAVQGQYCENSKAPSETPDSAKMDGQWTAGACDPDYKPVYGNFVDAKDNPGKTCCVKKTTS